MANPKKYLDLDGLAYFLQKIKNMLSGKVDKETGKGLSSNDYTSTEKAKLANIAEGAQVNAIENIAVNGATQTITSKLVNINVPTKTSDITNDSGFITTADISEGSAASTTVPLMDGTAAVGTELAFARGDHRHPSDSSKADVATTLSGYGITDAYTKSEVTGLGYQTAAQVTAAINDAIAGITGITYEVVAELPATGSAGVIYLVSNSGSASNIYDEYIWVTNRFEKIGSTDIDLSGYLLRSELVAVSNSEIDTIVAGN